NIFGAVERVNDHVAAPPVHEPRQRYWRIIAKRAILATGAEERPITFGGNDVPGVMTAAAMRTFANHYGVSIGEDFAAPFGLPAYDRGGGLVAGGFDAEYGEVGRQWTFACEELERRHGSNIRARRGANTAH